ncbi:hypothetical protein C6P97_07645 [Burkholderia multivorans]|nr:hypothetical protein C6P97_07645 [Burkholderia multivorans]
MNPSTLPAAANQQLAEIAATTLGLETLETRHADRLDFHDTAVWCIRDALEAAWLAGAAYAGRHTSQNDPHAIQGTGSVTARR